MANQEQLEILKQGVDTWNDWVRNNDVLYPIGDEDIDLSGADLRGHFLENVILPRASLNGANLESANLAGANIFRAGLYRTNLRLANLSRAQIRETIAQEAILIGADLSDARFSDVDMTQANLKDAIFVHANLQSVLLEQANLENADFSRSNVYGLRFKDAFLLNANIKGAEFNNVTFNKTDLSFVTFEGAMLNGVSFTDSDISHASMGYTSLIDSDLSSSRGLDTIVHIGKSNISTNTLFSSKGEIPEVFLRGCGLSDWEIETAKLYKPNLTNQEIDEILYRVHDLRAHQPVQISPLFISYSHADSGFVDKMEKSLDKLGIRFWRDTHHATAGRLEKQIDLAIRHNPTVLVILSKNSIESDWVEFEVNLARKIEKETKRDVLCPVALDDSWKTSSWSEITMEQVKKYNILDFSQWNDDEKFEKMFIGLKNHCLRQ
jgi:uncharacterized protein YjbI with pentapeptide repeats